MKAIAVRLDFLGRACQAALSYHRFREIGICGSGIADDLIVELLLMDDTDWGPTLNLVLSGSIHSLEDYRKKQELMRTTRKAMRAGDTPFKVEG